MLHALDTLFDVLREMDDDFGPRGWVIASQGDSLRVHNCLLDSAIVERPRVML
jgi:hypothetical protein